MKTLLTLLALLLLLPGVGYAQVFLPDDPLWEDPDRLDSPKPEPRDPSEYYDFIINTLGRPGDYEGPAVNVNTLGEVPNSSWFTNRHGRHEMSVEELKRGPNEYQEGPSKEGPWKVVDAKTEGKTPGLQIVDTRGDRYLLKFDSPGYLNLTTGAEVVSTRLLHALGYHVPENYITYFRNERLVPGEDATYESDGEEHPIDEAFIDYIMQRVPATDDGNYRALASRFLPGEPLGPFNFHGTRPDDMNDIFDHEARRELRALKVFSAWINNVDARSQNSLDMYVEEEGRSYVRHHLIDFGSTLGAGALGPKDRWFGYEYAVEPGPVAARALTLGFGRSDWFDLEYSGYPSVGLIDVKSFEPDEWKNQYPNAAFERMDAADAFWAAKQVMSFSDEDIEAIVSTGRYDDPAAERYLVDVLIGRRDKIGREYLSYGGGLAAFRVAGGEMLFEDLPAMYGFSDGNQDRRVTWRTFNNESGEVGEVLAESVVTGTAVDLPEVDESFVTAGIQTSGEGMTRVFLRREGDGYGVAGVRRFAEGVDEPYHRIAARPLVYD